MRKQEQSRLAELAAEKANYEAIQAQLDIVSNMLLISNSLKYGIFSVVVLCNWVVLIEATY